LKIGILGGGQLARMLALAGYPLGVNCVVLDPAPDACARQVAEFIQGAYDDREKLLQLAERVDVVTFDFENVPAESLRFLAQYVPVLPSPTALAAAQDRLTEKTLFRDLDIPTPPFATVDNLDDLHQAIAEIGLPAVLKTRRLGYDGKGQRLLHNPPDVTAAWQELQDAPLLLEGFVPFQQEASMLAVRARDGRMAFYPLTENRHRNGVLRVSIAPLDAPALTAQAQDFAERLLTRLDYVGLLAVEFFVQDGALLANEMAPRVHNSGHWTIEGAATSQFENHLRALLGLPLGSTAGVGCAAMVNCLGALPERNAVLALPDTHWHDYGKAPRPGRKVGHITLRASERQTLQARLQTVLARITAADKN